MNIPILRLSYSQEDIDFIKNGIIEVLKSGYLTMGEKVRQFEKAFAQFTGVKYTIATNSGTSSIEIILRAIGIEGSTVMVPSNTFMATATVVVHAGGKIIFTDCQRENLQMDPEDLKKKIRSDTKAVILVHIGGIISPHLDEIKRICDDNGLFLIEDAAHAHGATIDGRKAGTLGIAGSFSFYPTKVLTTAEGGMITTDNEDIYQKSIILRDHGKANPEFNIHTEFGYNWRFSELHALLGLQQMQKAVGILEERRKIAKYYDKELRGLKGLSLIPLPPGIKSSYYKYIAFLEDGIDREFLKNQLGTKFNIHMPGEVYSNPLHSQPVFQKYPWTVANSSSDTFPDTEYVCKHHFCLPLYPGLSKIEINYIISSLKKVLS